MIHKIKFVLFLIKLINFKWKYQTTQEYYENPLRTMRLDAMLLGDYMTVVGFMKPAEYIASYINQTKLEKFRKHYIQ